MANLRPMTRWEHFSAGEFFFETTLALGTIVIGAAQGVKELLSDQPKYWFALVVFSVAIIMGTVLIARAAARRRKALQSADPHSLDAVLHILHSLLMVFSNVDDAGLRLCVFVPGNKPNQIHQITNYVGVDRPYGCRRDMSDSCGIVGLAFRSGAAQYDSLPRNTHIIDYLVHTYGFSKAEAAEMKSDRQSWAAVPVGGPGEVIAAIFLDCKIPKFFGNSNSQKKKMLEAATLGVAQFLGTS